MLGRVFGQQLSRSLHVSIVRRTGSSLQRVLARETMEKLLRNPTLECLVTALFGLRPGGDCELLSPRTLPFLHSDSHEPSVVISRSADAVRRGYGDSSTVASVCFLAFD